MRFLSPVRFLARKAEWHARRDFTSVLFSCSNHATGPVRLDTAVHLWFGRMIRRTPRVYRAGPARESSMFFISCGTRTRPVRDPQGRRTTPPYGHVREFLQPELTKIPHGRRIWPYGPLTVPLRSPHGLFTGCLGYQNRYGARKLIMLALKLYGPRTGRQNSYGAARGPWVDVRFFFKTTREQPGNSPYGARECDVTGALPGKILCIGSALQITTEQAIRVNYTH